MRGPPPRFFEMSIWILRNWRRTNPTSGYLTVHRVSKFALLWSEKLSTRGCVNLRLRPGAARTSDSRNLLLRNMDFKVTLFSLLFPDIIVRGSSSWGRRGWASRAWPTSSSAGTRTTTAEDSETVASRLTWWNIIWTLYFKYWFITHLIN